MKVVSNNEQFITQINCTLARWKELSLTIVEYGMVYEEEAFLLFTSLDSIEELGIFFEKQIAVSENGKVITAYKKNGRMVLLDYSLIYFIEAIGREVHAYTEADGFLLKQRLYQFEALLGFCRVNKSTIVNLRTVRSITPYINGKLLLILTDEQEIEVSRKYVKSFREIIKDRRLV